MLAQQLVPGSAEWITTAMRAAGETPATYYSGGTPEIIPHMAALAV
jgi:hypothetical protein